MTVMRIDDPQYDSTGRMGLFEKEEVVLALDLRGTSDGRCCVFLSESNWPISMVWSSFFLSSDEVIFMDMMQAQSRWVVDDADGGRCTPCWPCRGGKRGEERNQAKRPLGGREVLLLKMKEKGRRRRRSRTKKNY